MISNTLGNTQLLFIQIVATKLDSEMFEVILTNTVELLLTQDLWTQQTAALSSVESDILLSLFK